MEIINIEESLVDDDFKTKLELIEKTANVKIHVHGDQCIISPPSTSAKTMVLSLARITSAAAYSLQTVLIPFRGQISEVVLEEVKTIALNNDVTFLVKKKGIELEGKAKQVALAKEQVEFLAELVKSMPTSPSNSPEKKIPDENHTKVRDQFGRFATDGTPKKKPSRRVFLEDDDRGFDLSVISKLR